MCGYGYGVQVLAYGVTRAERYLGKVRLGVRREVATLEMCGMLSLCFDLPKCGFGESGVVSS